MNVLVTGGAGFIGSHLVGTLLSAGHRVRVLDNLSTGKLSNLGQARAVDMIEGDIRDRKVVADAVHGTDAIVHLAAVASVQASIDDPVGTHETNLVGTLNLLEAARAHRVGRFVYASSAAVYGDTQHLPVAEHNGVAPLSPYAADKLAGEHYLDFYRRKFDLKGTAYRFFNIYGPRQDPSSPYSGVISIFAQRVSEGAPVIIFGDGQQTRDFVYVGDLVQLLAQTLTNDATIGQVMNVGRGTECSLLELLAELERIAGRKTECRHEPARIGDILRSCADVGRLRAAGGQVPTTPLALGLKQLLGETAG